MGSRNLAAAVATYAAKRIRWFAFRDTAVIFVRGLDLDRRDFAMRRLGSESVELNPDWFAEREGRSDG